jgi:hypothetical protein
LHRPLPLPASELVTPLLATPQLDEVVTFEAAIDARSSWERIDAGTPELVKDPTWSPARVLPTDLADRCLELRGELMTAALRSVRAIREAKDTVGLVASYPPVDRLSRDTEMLGDLGDLPAVLQDRHDCLIALIHDTDLH